MIKFITNCCAASVDEEVRYNDFFYVLPEEAEYVGVFSVIEAGD